MSWTINLVKNTVVIPAKKIDVVNKLLQKHYYYDDELPVYKDGTLSFDSDSMEHMDWLCRNEKAMAIIALSGAEGNVHFADLEGDNAGTFWGVRFENKGYQILDGHIVYFTQGEVICPKKKR